MNTPFKTALRQVIGGKSIADRVKLYRDWLRANEDFSRTMIARGRRRPRFTPITDHELGEIIAADKRDGLDEATMNHFVYTFPRWRERERSVVRRKRAENAAKARWEKKSEKKALRSSAKTKTARKHR